MEKRHMKEYVVVKFNDGKYKVWADYGNAWGSPIYEVLDYCPDYKSARELIKQHRLLTARRSK